MWQISAPSPRDEFRQSGGSRPYSSYVCHWFIFFQSVVDLEKSGIEFDHISKLGDENFLAALEATKGMICSILPSKSSKAKWSSLFIRIFANLNPSSGSWKFCQLPRISTKQKMGAGAWEKLWKVNIYHSKIFRSHVYWRTPYKYILESRKPQSKVIVKGLRSTLSSGP